MITLFKKEKANESLIDLLKETLERAEKGEIVAGSVAYVLNDRKVEYRHSTTTDDALLHHILLIAERDYYDSVVKIQLQER